MTNTILTYVVLFALALGAGFAIGWALCVAVLRDQVRDIEEDIENLKGALEQARSRASDAEQAT